MVVYVEMVGECRPQPLTSGTHGVNFAPQVVGVPIRRVAVLTECHNRVCLPFLPESFAPCPPPCLALVL